VQQKPQAHVEITQPKFRGHSGGSLLTHDSIFKVVSPSTEAILEFESVDLLFNFLGSFFTFGPLPVQRTIRLVVSRISNSYPWTDTIAIFASHMTIVSDD
jgi:hypothetical protein